MASGLEQLRAALRLRLASAGSAARRWCAAATASTTRRRSRTRFSPWRKARRPPPALRSSATSSARRISSSAIRSPARSPTARCNFAVSNDQNMRDSYIQQWNFNVQHKLPGNVVLDVGYVGSKGTQADRHLRRSEPADRRWWIREPRAWPRSMRAVPIRTTSATCDRDKSIGNSIYHSLQVKAERRLAPGLIFLTAYTCSQVDLRTVRYRRTGGRRQLHRRAAGRLLHARRPLDQRLRRDAALRADRAVRSAVRTRPARRRQEGAGRLAALHHHDLPERLPGPGDLQHRYHRHRHQLAARLGARPERQPARRSAHLDSAGSTRPPSRRRRSAASAPRRAPAPCACRASRTWISR